MKKVYIYPDAIDRIRLWIKGYDTTSKVRKSTIPSKYFLLLHGDQPAIPLFILFTVNFILGKVLKGGDLTCTTKGRRQEFLKQFMHFLGVYQLNTKGCFEKGSWFYGYLI